uniref:Immunoglobulin V-set domain-containing protein n=1 Tax=Seriola lalandi dorsalis TaxID=1841481 RepID=A0A3B4Y4S7_SERLL
MNYRRERNFHIQHSSIHKPSTLPLFNMLSLDYYVLYSNPYLLWYKQVENDFPKFLLRRYSGTKNTQDSQENRFNAEINNKSVPLKIQKLQVSDSAVYYCALRPTVTGNTKTLYKNLWSKDNAILHNIHYRESHTVTLQGSIHH